MAYKIYVCTSFSVTSPCVCVCESFFCLANRFHIDIFFSKKSRFPSIWVHAEHILHCCLDLVCFGFFSRLFLSVNIIIVCITWCFIYYFMQAKCNEIHSHNGYPTLYLIPLSLSLSSLHQFETIFCCVVSFLIHARFQNISHRRIHHSIHKSVVARVRLGFNHSIECHSIRLHFILHSEYYTVKLIAIN